MPSIEIDAEVFEYLQSSAIPFIDTPNSVLRRILLGDIKKTTGEQSHTPPRPRNPLRGNDVDSFINKILSTRAGERFRVRPRYQYMFESQVEIIYFQNFAQAEAPNLWYRLRRPALQIMRESGKNALIVLTNPLEGIAYEIPLSDIDHQIGLKSWTRPDLEVNIDQSEYRWRELDWDLSLYLKKYE